MRILQIFNRYAYLGGEELAVDQITSELIDHHQLRNVTFDSQEWSKASGLINRVKQTIAMAWNPESIRIVANEIKEFKPEVILLHNLMPVGSGGLYVFLTSLDIPVVQFIHNFRPFSVNGYCWGNGKILPNGLQKNFLPEIFAGSWQNSRVKTAWYGAILLTLHQLGTYRKIDGWIAISNFMKQTFVESGIDEDRIAVISHSWSPQCEFVEARPEPDDEPTFLFLGRLTEEKGLRILLKAWEQFEQASHYGKLLIAGDGPLADEVGTHCANLKRANFLGFKSGLEKRNLLERCAALIVPSIWWEPLGLVLYEAYDYGKPVLAARSGGILDHVQDGVTGWLHDPGDFATLASHMLEAVHSPETRCKRGANGRKLVLKRSANVWIQEFNQFVGQVIERSALSRITPSGAPDTDGKSQVRQSEVYLRVYLADQNPGYDRSYGISRMSQVILEALGGIETLHTEVVSSRSSQQPPKRSTKKRILPWGTRNKTIRFLTDHIHPLICRGSHPTDALLLSKGLPSIPK